MKIIELDLKGLACPLPILKTKKKLSELESGDKLIIYATDDNVFEDFKLFCQYTGHCLLDKEVLEGKIYKIILQHR